VTSLLKGSLPLLLALALPRTAVAQSPAPTTEPLPPSELQGLTERLEGVEAELAATQSALVEVEQEAQKLRIYGFLDFGLKKAFPAKDPFYAALIERKLTFVLGNINLYIDAQPAPSWRALIETRLTTYPHGTETVSATGDFGRIDNRIYDTGSPSGRNEVIWGGVVLERAQIEHTMLDLFNLRVGYFLTPYGIWNVDHGTPTLISLVLPSSQVEGALPARQLGVQAYGGTVSGDVELGYAAYVSNGRAPFLEDPTDGKAFGGRVHADFVGPDRRLKLGLSGYVGDSLETKKTLRVGDGGVAIDVDPTYAYSEWGLGADASLDWGNFRLRTEGLVHSIQHEAGKHEPIAFAQPGLTHPNHLSYYWYSIIAYRWRAFEPYSYTELKYVTPRDGYFDLGYLPGLGLNIYFSPQAQLKTQYVAAKFYRTDDAHDASDRNFRVIDSRFVLSF
jgi:hypothetical protein